MQKTLKKWLPSEVTLQKMGSGRLVRWLTARKGVWSLHRRALAAGLAMGLFVGLTPTVGFQTPLILVGALLFRANFPAAFLALWVSNPITTPLLYWGFNRLGAAVFGDLFPVESFAELAPFMQMAIQQSTYLWAGSLLLAVPGAVLGYAAFIGTWRWATVRRWRQRSLLRRTKLTPGMKSEAA
ncbi:MAG TPA: DUF2062 domain-containing protein [Gammaproteobacteria bacterium]|nr:DUF2062 domain-containing protein [Gammaproteobacteria bacterium]